MKYTNKHNLPKSIYNALTHDDYDLSNVPNNIISVTSLIDAPKAKILFKRHYNELEVDAIDRLWMMDGSADHYILQMSNQKDGNSLSEERWYYCVDNCVIYTLPKGEKAIEQDWYKENLWYVSGKFDNYINEELEDYKRTSVWNFVYNPEGKPEYHRQLNIHAYILEQLGFKVNKCRIVMILKDWTKSKIFDYGYPGIPIQDINIPIWDSVETYKYINDRVELFKEVSKLADDEIPACSSEERWYNEGKVAVMKSGNKKASKVFAESKRAEAQSYIDSQAKPEIYSLEDRPGKNNRCEDYCDCNQFCDFYKGL